eukprot:285514_1
MKHNTGKKKARPTLNFHAEDDTIHYDARMKNELNVDSQELETIDRNAHDESETSAEDDTTCIHTEEYNQETGVEPENYVSEGDAPSSDYQVIDNIAEGFVHLHVFSPEDEQEESASASECDWEIMSGVQSVQSYRENECMFTYKDAVQVQMQTNGNPASTVSFAKVNLFHKITPAIQSPPLARTFPTTTTKVLPVEEKEDGDNVEFDAFFEYDGYKGGRGRNSFQKQKSNSCNTLTKRWYIKSRYGECKRGRGGKPFRFC